MVQGHRWRGAEPEPHHRAHGPPGLRWTARGLLVLNWTQGSGSGAPEWKFWYIYQKYLDIFIKTFWFCTLFSMHLIIVPAGRFCVPSIIQTLLTGITAAGNSCLLRSPSRAPGRLWLTGLPVRGNDMAHEVDTNQKSKKICEKSTLNAEQVLASMHGQAGRVTRWCQCCDITTKTQKKQLIPKVHFSRRSKMRALLSTSAPFGASSPLREALS